MNANYPVANQNSFAGHIVRVPQNTCLPSAPMQSESQINQFPPARHSKNSLLPVE